MKKLMVAAAAAAMTAGAFAGACDDTDIVAGAADCLVYDVQLKLKTLVPAKIKCYNEDSCGETTACGQVYYLKDGTRKINGYMWLCDRPCCIDETDDVRIVLFDKSNKTAVIPLTYAVEGTKVVQYPETFNFDFLSRYGKSAGKLAAAWAVSAENLELSCAGLGGSVFTDPDPVCECVALPKSISGYCAGTMDISTIMVPGKCGEEDEYTAKIAGLCEEWDSWCEDGDEASTIPVCGTWTIKYNKSLSKENAKSMLTIVPSYALELE